MSNSPLNLAFKLATAGLALSLFLWITLASLGPYPAPAKKDATTTAASEESAAPKFDPFDPAYDVEIASPAELPRVQITSVEPPAAPESIPTAVLTAEVDSFADPEIPTIDIPGESASANEIPTLTISERTSSAPADSTPPAEKPQFPIRPQGRTGNPPTSPGNESIPELPALPAVEVPTPEPEIPALEIPTAAADVEPIPAPVLPLEPDMITEPTPTIAVTPEPIVAPKPTIVIAPDPELTAELDELRQQQQTLEASLAKKAADLDAVRRENQTFQDQLAASQRDAETLQKSASDLELLTADLRDRQSQSAKEIAALRKQLDDAEKARKTAENRERQQAQLSRVREPQPVPALRLEEELPPLPEKSKTQLELESLYAVPPAVPTATRRQDPFGDPMPPAPEAESKPPAPAASLQWDAVFASEAGTCESCGACGTCGDNRERLSLFGEIESFFLRHKHTPAPPRDPNEPKGLLAKWNARRSCGHCGFCGHGDRCTEAAAIYGMPMNAAILPPEDRTHR